ncbi:MAG: succinate dehydrogenase cytochrome b subunit [Cryobacterium sp.]|nr:succinate dehydrogenase cytochrome b subunit [Oligoflexia bacterium]
MKTNFASSTLGRKFVMAITGLLLVGFLVAHLSGNFLLYQKEGSLFNAYAQKLASFGVLLYAAEVGLVAFFGFHAYNGIRLAFLKQRAKPVKYAVTQSKAGNSKWGLASNNMMVTGSVLLVFIVLHVIHFKYGRGLAEGYAVQVNNEEARDLHRLVVEEFKKPLITVLYTAVMVMLGFHLRHGIWSAFQTLGLTKENNSNKIYFVGGVLGVFLGFGFLTIPLYIYFFV